MIYLISRILIGAFGLLLAAYVVPDIVVDGLYIAIIAAVILGVLNMIVKPILVILTLPVTIITLGLFIFVINAALFMFVASFIEGFTVNGFIPALLGSLIVTVVSTIGNRLL